MQARTVIACAPSIPEQKENGESFYVFDQGGTGFQCHGRSSCRARMEDVAAMYRPVIMLVSLVPTPNDSGSAFTGHSEGDRAHRGPVWERCLLLFPRLYACESSVGLDSGLRRIAYRHVDGGGFLEWRQRFARIDGGLSRICNRTRIAGFGRRGNVPRRLED